MRMRQGVVTQVTPFLVAVGNNPDGGTPCAVRDGYQPAIGDVVKVFIDGTERYVDGRIKP